jgi:hypothetical protein
MTISQDTDEQRKWMVDQWHQYGKTFSVFTPDEQPAPDIWEPDLPGADDKGNLHPNALQPETVSKLLFPSRNSKESGMLVQLHFTRK